MAVAKKHRRKITVGDRHFLWHVAEDQDHFPPTTKGHTLALNIVSDDKQFIVRYHLNQPDSNRRHITVVGPEFGTSHDPGSWRRFLCPDWCADGTITPGSVREIIEWCLESTARIPVDYTGAKV